MLKILIADDEKIIRKGIINGYNWKNIGIDAVLEARNGAEALAVYEKEVKLCSQMMPDKKSIKRP